MQSEKENLTRLLNVLQINDNIMSLTRKKYIVFIRFIHDFYFVYGTIFTSLILLKRFRFL